jgi:hypothetical protein
VQIICIDPTKIPAGRLYNLHGKLFQLLFTAELASGSGTQREVTNAGNDVGNAGGGVGSGSNGTDTCVRSDTQRNNTISQSNGGSNQQVEPGAGKNGRQVPSTGASVASNEVILGNEVYKLLL